MQGTLTSLSPIRTAIDLPLPQVSQPIAPVGLQLSNLTISSCEHTLYRKVYCMAGSERIERWEVQLRKGSLELAIMASLSAGPLYGLEILRRLDGSSLNVPEGTIYPLLARLKAEAWVESEWVEAERGHPRKYYRLTAAGRRHLHEMSRAWSNFAATMESLLSPVNVEDSDDRRLSARTAAPARRRARR